jgi:hypothetical protein
MQWTAGAQVLDRVLTALLRDPAPARDRPTLASAEEAEDLPHREPGFTFYRHGPRETDR